MSDECEIEMPIPYGEKLVIEESESLDQTFERTKKNIEKSIDGEESPTVVSFHDPEMIRELLTPKRREIMNAIIKVEPESIKELAETVDRGLSEVHSDLKTLEECKIVYFEREGRKKRPVIPYRDIEVRYNLKEDVMNMETDFELEKA